MKIRILDVVSPILFLVVFTACPLFECDAEEISIANQSFEEPLLGDGTQTQDGVVPDWNGEGSIVVMNIVDALFSGSSIGSSEPNPLNGYNALLVNGTAKAYQELPVVLEPQLTYTLTCLVGHRFSHALGNASVNLWAGEVLLVSGLPNPPEDTFAPFSLTYVSPSTGSMIGQPLRIEFSNNGEATQAWFDDVRLFAGTPGLLHYGISRDFSIDSNPNGDWSYGWKETLSGDFTPFSANRTSSFDNGVPVELWELAPSSLPFILHNATSETGISNSGQQICPPGCVTVNPGFNGQPQNFGVIRFTVPNGGGGNYTLECAAQHYLNGDRAGDTELHITVNGIEVFGEFIPPLGGTGYSNTFTLFTGDTIDFMIGRGEDNNEYGSALNIDAVLSLPEICTPHRAIATAELVNGFVVGATIVDSGCGYTNAPIVMIKGGGGSGAMGKAIIEDGKVIGIEIMNAGCCYTSAPQILIASPPFEPKVSISVSKVNVNQYVVLGEKYVLESSTNLVNWEATGPTFTAESEYLVDEFDVDDSVRRYFRLRVVP